jgi:hypothetical protein
MEVPPAAGPAPPSPSLFSRLFKILRTYWEIPPRPRHSRFIFARSFLFLMYLYLRIVAAEIIALELVRPLFPPPSHWTYIDFLLNVVSVLFLMVCLLILGRLLCNRAMQFIHFVKGKCWPSRGAREDVLMDPHLLTKILDFFVGGDPASIAARETLSHSALVSKWWKDVSRADILWRLIVVSLLPAPAEALKRWRRPLVDRSKNEFAPYLIRYGKLLTAREDSLVDQPVGHGCGDLRQ